MVAGNVKFNSYKKNIYFFFLYSIPYKKKKTYLDNLFVGYLKLYA